jgi:hypothetical protein
MHPRARIALVPIVVLAGVAWAVIWGLNGGTSGGPIRVPELDAGSRALLNPALVAVFVAAMAWASGSPRSAGSLLAVVGLGTMVAGNVLAFGLVGSSTPLSGLGGPAFVAGAVATVSGLAVKMGQAAARSSGRSWVGGSAGVGTAIGVTLMTIAAPPAASLALFPLVEALVQGGSSAAAAAPAPRLLAAEAQG